VEGKPPIRARGTHARKGEGQLKRVDSSSKGEQPEHLLDISLCALLSCHKVLSPSSLSLLFLFGAKKLAWRDCAPL